MKIQAISANSFKGLFTDKSKENGGNWKMEYSPYSWESNNTSKMAPKERFTTFDSILPDNEEIFEKNIYSNRESSKDILGTESYYKTSDGIMRRTITEVPAMNREDSLKVLNDKLGVFLEHKKYTRGILSNYFDRSQETFNEASKTYDKWAAEHGLSVWNRSRSKTDLVTLMNKEKAIMVQKAGETYDKAGQFIKLIDSIDAVKSTIDSNTKEINKIAELRKSGLLVDISRRDIPNPDAALEPILNNTKNAIEKFISLPNRLLSVKELINIAKLNHLDLKTCISLIMAYK